MVKHSLFLVYVITNNYICSVIINQPIKNKGIMVEALYQAVVFGGFIVGMIYVGYLVARKPGEKFFYES